MTDASPYTVPKERGGWRAALLAALVHLALLIFLWIGVQWQSETPTTIEAEVWSPQAREAAPAPVPQEEAATPPPAKAPPKIARVEPPPPPPPPPKVETRPEPKPDIALEQEKKRKEQERRKRLEEEEQERQERLAKLKEEKLREQKRQEEKEKRLAEEKRQDEKRREEKRLAELKEKEREKEQKRQEEERLAKAKEAEEKKRQEKEKADRAKLAAEKKRKEQEAADEARLTRARDEEMRRIAGGVTGSGGNGDAPRSQGGRADSEYAGRVGAKIKSNINFNVPDDLASNTAVEYRVNLLPDGSVAGIQKVKSSGINGFDEAVRRAIEKSQPYPKDKTGSVPSSFIGIHKPKDQ